MATRKAQLLTQAQDWPAINPSRLRHVVQIQRQTTTQDEFGGEISSWSVIRSPWASIEAAQMKENFQSGQFSGQVTYTIAIRWAAEPVILGGMRVAFQAHTYLIQTVDNVELRNVRVNLMCVEIDGAQ